MRKTREAEIQEYLMKRLEMKCNLVTKKQLQNASKRMSTLVHQLTNDPACESAAIRVVFSVRKSSEDIVKENDLDCDVVCSIVFIVAKEFSRSLSPRL
ncbi:MAG: hypothetical protein ABSB28_05010 [Candidatus Bathyarchaeia archaeon]